MLIHWYVALYVIIDCYVRSSSSTTGRLRFPLPRSLRSSARRLSYRWLVCRRAHLVSLKHSTAGAARSLLTKTTRKNSDTSLV
uniref:Putative secreted protein n=1 Tax=Anopheles darlingi TaxID=43151 RepID=A0A2M4D4E4_ANODA